MSKERHSIILAAGLGTRMKSSKPKVLHPILGRTLLGHVLRAVGSIRPQRRVVVVGAAADQVTDYLDQSFPDAETALQAEQNGTGHAVRVALDASPDMTGTVVVTVGDAPLIRAETFQALVDTHEKHDNAATVLTAVVDDPTGLGRIVRDSEGKVERNVEHRDADDATRAIHEINSGMYAFDVAALREALDKVTTDNEQGEEYLTDVLEILRDSQRQIGAHVVDDPTEVLGCNNRAQLASLSAIMRERINRELMLAGVTIDDPATTWIDATVTVGRDVTIHPNCQLKGATAVDAGASIGPDSTLIDTIVDADATVVRTHADQARIGAEATVGPFTHLRPGSNIGTTSRAGAFVEMKNSEVGSGSKVPHLSYLGDTTVGEKANVGCGVIVANYDGVDKHRTDIGDGVFVGCDSVLVAPVNLDDGSYVAAGSVVTNDVHPGELAVARSRQRNIDDWVPNKRPGTVTAEAAERALREEGDTRE
ncbi:bifunctional UDP-N-acetylglucosamine diphosphorylase/glucosamine-1-phosphate N-acetyltransferase GlmU [Haloglycomyces albus]|uniref:bifunctional UDP-N-acetylglucosamine diphosphorylase/glucosamine-1-phosphate N-acetyltransferase GlmU n=1 Tax=Haloglycomyces albus TaxID=526067 RepID=UPI00046CDACB|nr:bifunctional UDP-N-acetylglucosamine diphosphorylase/glucosamine-1-phosphate N-acetyltransferase GlmU [Haloglycomyces albus]